MNKAYNPFVPIPRSYLLLILLYFAVYSILTPSLKFLLIDTQVAYASWRFILFIIYQFLLFFPVIFYRSSFGLMHPLLFLLLIDTAKSIMKAPHELLSFLNVEPLFEETIISRGPLANQNSLELSEFEVTMLLLQMLALVSMYAGYFSRIKWKTFILPIKQPRYLKLVTLSIISVSLLIFLLYLNSRGGLTSHFSTFGGGRQSAIGGDGFIMAFINFGFLASLIWYAFDRKALRNPAFWVALIVSVPTQFLLRGSRSSLVYAAIMFFMVYILKTHKIPAIRVTTLGLVAMMSIGILGELRKSTFQGEGVDWTILSSHDAESALETYTSDVAHRDAQNPGITALSEGIKTTGLLWGKTYLGGLLFFIPRAIWPSKPHSIGYYTGTILYGSTGGKPPGDVIEAYWNFHIVGVFAVFFLYGTFLNWLGRMLTLNNHPAFHVIYIITLFYFSPGNLGMVKCFHQLAAVLIILWLVRAIPPRLQFNNFKF